MDMAVAFRLASSKLDCKRIDVKLIVEDLMVKEFI